MADVKSLRNREEYWYARTARKQHRCEDYVCERRIEPGTRYVELKLPPGGEMGYEGWHRMRLCVPCASNFNRDLVERLGLAEAVRRG